MDAARNTWDNLRTWAGTRSAGNTQLAAGLAGALFVLRVSLESGTRWWWFGILGAAICAWMGWIAWRRSWSQSWLNILWLYVVWPAAQPALAYGLGFVSVASLLIDHSERKALSIDQRVADVGVFIGAAALYIATLAPGLLPADSGEFQIVGPLLGVAHPPGYALFTLLAKLFALLPAGTVAWRVNLMGALSGAATLVIVQRTARRIARTPWAGLIAAGALGVSTTFWSQSTTINIRMLTVLFMALCCYFLTEFLLSEAGSAQSSRMLTAFAAVFGFGVAHHSSLVFFLPLFAITVLWHDPGLVSRWRIWPRLALAFLAPFVVNLYIVARAISGAPFGTDQLTDGKRILDHLLMRGFGGDMFAHLEPNRFLWERFRMIANVLDFQFGWVLLLIAAAGFVWLLWTWRIQGTLLGGMFATLAFVVATYRAPQSVEYLMPAYVPIALCTGCATAWFTRSSQRLGPLLIALSLLAIVVLGKTNLVSYAWLSADHTARDYAQTVLQEAPENAHVLTNWHWGTPLWYLQLVEGQRPDVTVEYVPPQGPVEMPYAWPQIITQRLAESDRPLVVTNYYPTYVDLAYRFAPLGDAFVVRSTPSFVMPDGFTRIDIDLEGRIRVLGYRLTETEVQPGGTVVVDVAWQPLVPLERDYAFFVHLVGPDGVPLGQDDRQHTAAPSYAVGEVLVDRYEFPVLLHAAPGTVQLIGGAYITLTDGTWQRLATVDGDDSIALHKISVAPAQLPPVTLHPTRRAFAGGPTLVGVDYDDTWAEQRRVLLHWRASDSDTIAQLHGSSQVVGQARVPGGSGQAGYVTTAIDVPAGTIQLRLTLSAPEAGMPLPYRGAWGARRARPLALPAPRARQLFVPLGGKMALVGVTARDTWRAGTEARVALDLIGLRPIVRDYVVSVSVHGEGIVVPPSDWVPALGAIPTFKWVRGSRIGDVHLIDLPPEASGEAEIAVGVYDAFVNHRALAPLDERLMRLGRPTIGLKTVEIK